MTKRISTVGCEELSVQLARIAEKVTNLKTREMALRAMADVVVKHAKQKAAPGAGLYNGRGNLSRQICSSWSPLNPSEITLGWTSKGYYGYHWELGFYHVDNGKYYKRPHLRPALFENSDEVANAGLDVLRQELEGV